MTMTAVWFAVQGIPAEEFLERAELIDTSEPDEFYEAEISGALYPADWYIVLASDLALFDADKVKEWSEGGRIVAAMSDESTLFSIAMEWRDGRAIWSVSHERDGDSEPMIAVDGELPEAFEGVRKDFLEKQDGQTPEELAFEAPLELAFRVTGFRADEVGFHEDGPVWTILEQE